MKKFNYKSSVYINQDVMQISFRCSLPDEMKGRQVRVQAIFSQRQSDRRFPMDTVVEEQDTGAQIVADARIELPYVFTKTPRHKVTLIFALWCGAREWILDEQPFPVQKEHFIRPDIGGKRNVLFFIGCTIALPFLLIKDYMQEGHNTQKAMKRANNTVYRVSGYTYSPRQRHTDYFAARYESYVKKKPVLSGDTVLFLSERLPEPEGNLLTLERRLKRNPQLRVTEFLNTRTVDALKRKELRKCAARCAEADVIILEDFYPQLHRLSLRRETKVVQLWHACGAFKTFGLTRMGKPGGAPQSSLNHRNYDLAAVSSEAMRGIYAEAFGISTAKVKALGVPRTDVLFDRAEKQKRKARLYAAYPMLSGKTVVLFAPTFRGDGNKDAYYPEDAFDINRWMRLMPEDVVLIVKHHPFVRQPLTVDGRWKDRVLDLTGKDPINDLLLVTDLLITDYSSVIFEAALLDVPMLFYAFDKKKYMADRDFYFACDEIVPGPVEDTFGGLIRQANHMLSGRWSPAQEDAFAAAPGEKTEPVRPLSRRREEFKEAFLGALDGGSTERIAGHIIENYLRVENVVEKENEATDGRPVRYRYKRRSAGK